jgi:hypothetical protein
LARYENIFNYTKSKKSLQNCVLAYGMWNRKSQMKGLIPSPTCGLRQELAKHFTVVDTPEPYTTKTCSKCMEGDGKSFEKATSQSKEEAPGTARC